MHERVAQAVYYSSIHLVYASIVACAVWGVTSIRGTTAATKYWIWVLTAANFVVPTGAIVNVLFARHIDWARPMGTISDVAWAITDGRTASIAATIWVTGAAAMTARLLVRLRLERGATVEGPAVHGLLRPHIVLPRDIERVLTDEELNAVVLHELTHVRRRDNLVRLLFEFALCGLWFHPLLWLVGWRIAVLRELSCDEAVTERTNGRVLISALSKLAAPEDVSFLQATASAHLPERLKLLESPPALSLGAHASVVVLCVSIGMAGVFGTVAHTACCFVR